MYFAILAAKDNANEVQVIRKLYSQLSAEARDLSRAFLFLGRRGLISVNVLCGDHDKSRSCVSFSKQGVQFMHSRPVAAIVQPQFLEARGSLYR